MEATAILEYFAPLYEWLIKTNNKNGVEIGWDLTYGKGDYLKIQFIVSVNFLLILQSAQLQRERKCQLKCEFYNYDRK